MAQTFEPRAVLLVKLLALSLLGVCVFAGAAWNVHETPGRPLGQSVPQTIPFSHKHHVGDVGLDCRFCHAAVERHAFPGMPSAAVCLGCHSQLFADQAMFEPLRKAAARGRPLAWAQVNRLPDYVYFDHAVHVAQGVACAECHGRLDQMPLVQPRAVMEMKWCIACHEAPGPRLHPPSDVFSMPPMAPAAPARVAALEHRQRRSDCSTCHR